MNLKQRIKIKMAQENIPTNGALAEILGYSRQSIYNATHGRGCGRGLAAALAEWLGVSRNEVLEIVKNAD